MQLDLYPRHGDDPVMMEPIPTWDLIQIVRHRRPGARASADVHTKRTNDPIP